MPAPEISAFGDGDHEIGESGLTIDGGGFGAFPGAAWIYENADRTGAIDQLTIGTWNDIQFSGVDIPASSNNAVGTRYLFVQREDLAWSQGFSFALQGNTSAAISGVSFGEAQLVVGGQVITATLTNDTYLAAGTGPVGSTANTQALIDGIVSAQSELNSWNAERSNIVVNDIMRVSDTVVTLTLPALANYEITANETLTWTIPAQAIAGASLVIGSPTIGILDEASKVAVISIIFSTAVRKHAITANSRSISIS